MWTPAQLEESTLVPFEVRSPSVRGPSPSVHDPATPLREVPERDSIFFARSILDRTEILPDAVASEKARILPSSQLCLLRENDTQKPSSLQGDKPKFVRHLGASEKSILLSPSKSL